MRRAVRQYLLNPLAQELLGYQDELEGRSVVVDALDGKLQISVRKKGEPAESWEQDGAAREEAADPPKKSWF